MKSYIKYIILFIVLILIGVVGINLYSNDNLKAKETVANQKNTKENKEETKTSEVKEEKKETEQSEEIIVKNENPSTNESTSNVLPPPKEETKENPKENSVGVSENKENTSSENNNSSIFTQEVIEIDVTNNNYVSESTTPSTNTTTQNNLSTNNINENNLSNTNETETIILEIESIQEVSDTNKLSDQHSQNFIQNNPSSSSENTMTNNNPIKNNNTNNNNEEKKETTTTTDNNSTNPSTTEDITTGKKTNVSFSNIDNCINNKVIKKVKGSNGKTVKIRTCIEKFNLNNTNSMMQNFAITDQFIYFSNPARGAWVKQESTYQQMGKRAALKKTSANYVIRINRSTNTYQRIYVEFAGHTQSFDVINIPNQEQIYMNYFARLYKGSLGYGARYVGVTAIPFKSNQKASGLEVIPTTATSISSDGRKLSILKSSSYYTDGQFNANKFYDKVVSIGSSTGKMINPEVAVDEENNRIAFVSGTKAYIYNLEDFNKGKANLLTTFTIAGGKQGVELYNGYLYLWTGNKIHVLYKYKVSTGKLVNKINFNLYNYYGSGKGNEAEGISIYKGNVYIGIPGSKCNGKTCNDIFLVEGL